MNASPTPPLLCPAPRACEFTGWSGVFASLACTGEYLGIAERLLTPALDARGARWVNEPAGAQAILEVLSTDGAGIAGASEINIGVDGRLRIRILAGDEAGFRSALITLAQVFKTCGARIPLGRIVDAPAIAQRGLMLDVSRDRVPTMESLQNCIDQMELLKLNHLQLYTEHSFAYAGHEEVWRGTSPITAEELRELDAYSRERGVELVANQNCLGHLHRWLKLPRYAPLAEIPPSVPEWTFETDDGRAFTKTGPHSLCPVDPGSLLLVRDLLGQILPCCSSPLVNVGCDEAFDVGQGRSREEVGRRGRAAVYFDWLRAIDAIAREHGKQPMFWGDIALRHADRISDIPAGAIPLVWGYEADAPFARGAEIFAAESRPRAWMCPGTSSWLSITGRTRVRRGNLSSAARVAGSSGAGFLVCDWGDRGHRQQWPISMHAIAHAAHLAWSGGDPALPFDARAAAAQWAGAKKAELGPWMDELGEVDADLSAGLRNTNALFTELHRPLRERPADEARHGTLRAWQDMLERLNAMRSRLDSMSADGLDAVIVRELRHTLAIAEHSAEKAIVCRACLDEPGGLPRGTARIRLAASLATLIEEHRELWLARSRPGGLDDSARHYERIIDDYEHPEGSPA